MATAAADLAGDWIGTYQSAKFPTTKGTFHVTFVQSGTHISGTVRIASDCVADGTVAGTFTNDTITFGAVHAAETVTFSGRLAGGTLRGAYRSGPACGDDNGTWTATRN